MANLVFGSQNFSTTLNVGGGINNSQTTGIILTSVTGLDTNGGILCINWAATLDTASAEYIEYGGISGNELTGVTRGVEGTSAKAHVNGATVVAVVSKAHINRINDKLEGTDADGIAPAEINDANGNELVKFTATGSAVNEVTIANAATGNPPSISATGGDTNIDLKLLSKGTGVLTVTGTTNYETNVTDDDDIPNKKYVDDASGSSDGYIDSADTWVYASASTFTITGADRTGVYTKGTKLKFTQTSAKYAVVVSSSFGGGNTTVTIAVNTDYTIANAAITLPKYTFQEPADFPHRFNITLGSYTSGGGAFTNQPTTNAAYFTLVNKNTVLYTIDFTYHGTSGGSGTTTIQGLPFTIAAGKLGFGSGRSYTNGWQLTVTCDTTTTLYVDKYDGNTAIANSATMKLQCFQPI